MNKREGKVEGVSPKKLGVERSYTDLRSRRKDIMTRVKSERFYRSLSISPRNMRKEDSHQVLKVKNHKLYALFSPNKVIQKEGSAFNLNLFQTDFVDLYAQFIPQTGPRGSQKRCNAVTFNPPTPSPEERFDHFQFTHGYLLALARSQMDQNPVVLIPLDNAIIFRSGEQSFSVTQGESNGKSQSEVFEFQTTSPKQTDEWLYALSRLTQRKLKREEYDLVPAVCADVGLAQKRCKLSSEAMWKELHGDTPGWTLEAGTYEDFILWGLYCSSECSAATQALLLYSILYLSFDVFFTKFVVIWRKLYLTSESDEVFWHTRLQFMGEQVARSQFCLSEKEIKQFIQFCCYELKDTNCFRMSDLLDSLEKKEEIRLSLKNSAPTILPCPQISLHPEWDQSKKEETFTKLRAINVSSSDLAQQITLLEAALHSKLTANEFVNKNSGNALQTTTQWWNKVNFWVVTEILQQGTVKAQSKIVKKFIKLALKLYQIRNYNSCMQILTGVSHNVVLRLKKLQEAIPVKYKEILEDLSERFSPCENYGVYRTCLDFSSPCLRFLAVHQKDLVFILDGNTQVLGDDLLNFDRMYKISHCLSKTGITIAPYSFDYKFQPIQAIQNMIVNFVPLTEEALYKLSLKHEPSVRGGEPEPDPSKHQVYRNPLFQNIDLGSVQIKTQK